MVNFRGHFLGEFSWTFLVNFRGHLIVMILSSNKLTQTKVIFTGDAIETGRRCLFGPSVYIFVTYEGVSVLGTDGHRRQTQTDAITP